MEYQVRRASGLSLGQLARHQAEAFEEYPVAVSDDPQALADRVRTEQIDLHESFELGVGDRFVAQIFIARRGDRSRIASLGVPVSARRQGWAKVALAQAIDDARQRGDATIQLEVITTNTPAVRLYEAAGFTVARELLGFEGVCKVAAPELLRPIHPIPVDEAATQVACQGRRLPWQIDTPALFALGTDCTAWTNGPATAIIKHRADTLVLQSLLTYESCRRRGYARGLLRQLARHARPRVSRIRVAPLAPAGLIDEFMRRCGFNTTSLHQWEMAREV